MSVRIQVPQLPPDNEERPPPGSPPIAPEDLAELGVDLRFIPFIIPAIPQAERGESLNGLPLLSLTEARELVETLDKVVSSTADPNLKRGCFRTLRGVSLAHGVLPTSYFLSGVELASTIPHALGGFADIWRGQRDGSQVCVKAFRIDTTADPDKIKRRFYREIIGWKSVSHPNVLPFLGVSETLFPFCIITPWLPNGDIIEYTKRNHSVNRLQLLAQVASGLAHLHSLNIVHSNITPGNILITKEGHARLGNAGMIGNIADPTGVGLNSKTTSEPAAVRYMAPELLDPSQASLIRRNPPKECDVYSLAMTAFEILSDVLPYYGIQRESRIAYEILEVWDVIQGCWRQTPQSRLSVDLLHQAFVGSEPGQTGNIPVTEDCGETATEDISSAADSPLVSSPPDDNKLTQSEQPPTKPRSEPPGSLVQPPPVKRNLLKRILAGIRHAGGYIFRRGRR